MSIANDLFQLEQMHARGTLSDGEFQAAKQRVLLSTASSGEPLVRAMNGLRRSTSDRWIGGVCGGLALSTGIESWLWRLALVILTTLGGVGLVAYAVMWIFVPLDRHATALLPPSPPA